MNNIASSGAIDLEEIKWCQIASRDVDKFTVRRGDLLFNRTNSPELVGKTAVWDRDDVYAFAGYLVRVRFDRARVLPEYVSGFLNSLHGKRLLFAKAKPSIIMSNISPTELKRILIPLPPLAIQGRYAEVLEKVEAARQRIENTIPVADSLVRSVTARAWDAAI